MYLKPPMRAGRTVLTKRMVEALKPAAATRDVYDASLRGFSVRVHPSGRRVYRFKYVFAGRQRAVTIGEHGAPWTTETARTRAQILRGQVANRVDPLAVTTAADGARPLKLRDLIERYLEEGPIALPNKRPSSWTHDASRLRRHIIPLLGDKPARSLRRADVETAQRDIAAGATAADIKTGSRGRALVRGGPVVARGAVVSLSACLAWAISRDLVATNPAAKVEKFAAVKRERFLTEAETARLLDALASLQAAKVLPRVFADALLLLLFTGARKSEITALTWDEVDEERALVRLGQSRSKTGAKQIVLSEPAMQLIAQRPRGSRYVFPSPVDTNKPIVGVQKVWSRVRAAAAIDDVRVHDLRHSFASYAAAGGASLLMIAKALGHAHIATSQRYTHLTDSSAREVADSVGARIIGAPLRAQSPVSSASAPPTTSGRSAGDR